MADEVKRRLVHASGTAVPGIYLAGLVSWTQLRWLAVIGSVVTIALEVVRLKVGLDWRLFEELTREYEEDSVAGYALYVWSITAVALAFEPIVAVPAILMLTLGDPISGLLGSDELRTVKRPRVLVTMFLTCLVLALPFLHVEAAVLAAAGAAIADGVKPRVGDFVVDDNLSIPILAGVAGYAAVEFLPPVF